MDLLRCHGRIVGQELGDNSVRRLGPEFWRDGKQRSALRPSLANRSMARNAACACAASRPFARSGSVSMLVATEPAAGRRGRALVPKAASAPTSGRYRGPHHQSVHDAYPTKPSSEVFLTHYVAQCSAVQIVIAACDCVRLRETSTSISIGRPTAPATERDVYAHDQADQSNLHRSSAQAFRR